MALNITEIMADSKYDDGTRFVIGQDAEGKDIALTLGDLRKDYRSKDADYRQKTSRIADERRRLQEQEAAQQSAFLEAEAKLAEWTKQLMSANPNLSRSEAEDELQSDPRYKKLLDRFDKQEAALNAVQKRAEELAQAQAMDQKMRLVQAHQYTLAQLKQADTELDTEELVGFAQQRGIPRLDDAYYLMNRDKLTQRAIADELGRKLPEVESRIKRELSQPVLPVTRLVQPAPDAPKTMDAARDAALGDPEIIKILLGG